MEFAQPIFPYADTSYLKADFGQFSMLGRSIAGIETVIAVPQWGLTFDTGRAPDFAAQSDHLALTHWHLDHAAGLAFMLGLRRVSETPPLKILVPPAKREATRRYLEGLRGASDTEIAFELVDTKQPIQLKPDLTIRPIQNFHGIDATGYLVERTKSKLKPEFQGKDEAEIVRAKKAGEAVTQTETRPLLAYSGDTMVEFLGTEAAKAEYLVMECSFFGDDVDYAKCRRYGHTHIKDWATFAEKVESRQVIMIHTSQRYSKAEIESAIRRHLPASFLERLTVFR